MRARHLLAVAAIAAVVGVPSAQADHGDDGSARWRTVASGLDNPRGLAVS